jgi:hypothetical protein
MANYLTQICCNFDGSIVWTVDNSSRTIYQSTNYGNNFSLLYQDGNIVAISSISYNLLFNCLYISAGGNGSAYQFDLKSNTLLKTWKPNSGYNNCSGVAASDNGQYIYLIFNGPSTNQTYYSTNYGSTWTGVTITVQSPDSASSFGQGIFCSPSGQYVYTACNNGRNLYYSSNYGVSWNYRNYYTQMNNNVLNGLCLNSYKNILIWFGNAGFITG